MAIIFITNIFLARILSPEEFGILAIAYFFIAVFNVLVESGLGGALVRDKDVTEADYSTIFIFNLIISLLLYGLLCICSWQIEKYYNIPELNSYLKVLGLVLIINAFKIIQNVRLIRALNYKKISTLNFISIIISSIIGVIMALFGYGVWALILLQVLNALFSTILFWVFEKNIKYLVFNKDSFKKFYHFGIFTTLASMLDSFFDNIYQLFLAKYFNLNQTGYYYQAKKLTEVPVGVIKSTTEGVVFSLLSNIRDDNKQFRRVYSNVFRIFTICGGLVCLLIFIYAKEILYIIYGKKWLSANFYMEIFAVAYFFYMQEMFNYNLFRVFNKTHKIFILEIVKKSILGISIFIGIYLRSLIVLMYGFMISYMISYYINYYASKAIYRSSSYSIGLIYTFKVMVVSSMIVCLDKMFREVFSISFLYNIFYVPMIILIYFILLKLWNVIDIKRDLEIIKNTKL